MALNFPCQAKIWHTSSTKFYIFSPSEKVSCWWKLFRTWSLTLGRIWPGTSLAQIGLSWFREEEMSVIKGERKMVDQMSVSNAVEMFWHQILVFHIFLKFTSTFNVSKGFVARDKVNAGQASPFGRPDQLLSCCQHITGIVIVIFNPVFDFVVIIIVF